jgi:hypothetical protein
MIVSVHVVGPATGRSTSACFLQLTSRVAGGGTARYCLTGFRGRPGPGALVRIRGTITFRLPHRILRARVLVVDRFARDGKHARQTVTGTVAGGGTVVGGGTYVEDPPGVVESSDLRYRLTLR